MVSVESGTIFPKPYYSSKQLTSYDRRSIPGHNAWHSNDDWSGFIRYEENNGRLEKVLFDEEGPGAITRIITTGGAANARLRIYFDEAKEAQIVIPSFDISKMPIQIPPGMIYRHEHYKTHQGSSFYYPIPYAKRCKITVDNVSKWYVYHVNFRQYDPATKVETFSIQNALALHSKADSIGKILQAPPQYAGKEFVSKSRLLPGKTVELFLPGAFQAIRSLNFHITDYNKTTYGQLMRGLIVSISFDGVETVRAPFSDFSGAGMGAPKVDSWFLCADGVGNVTLRFTMPYKKEAKIQLLNITEVETSAQIKARISDWTWKENTLYFHASWRQENGLETNKGFDYNMATLTGRGIFKGDVLSLYNHSTRWYGEGDEHIWVDQESFPSHFGCGTEDYYNTTYAPIHVYHNAFGGAPREDDEASRGFNTFVRTRNLDVIPFHESLKFEFELISWDGGKVDYSSTVYWYGDLDSKSTNASPDAAALYVLPTPIYTSKIE
ncbi:hypothetical protein AHMF7605_08390 [Adhaeribacter arboris]|uniref:DUF2961 domain-containing protein n=2 Tax=Adhaeribacter arboris TaxID=2072846 RepID=A0A2T2YP14_9BACT|nr:hypothetical protein AHMF7605_08390 [Adhaeribacter arboris]